MNVPALLDAVRAHYAADTGALSVMSPEELQRLRQQLIDIVGLLLGLQTGPQAAPDLSLTEEDMEVWPCASRPRSCASACVQNHDLCCDLHLILHSCGVGSWRIHPYPPVHRCICTVLFTTWHRRIIISYSTPLSSLDRGIKHLGVPPQFYA